MANLDSAFARAPILAATLVLLASFLAPTVGRANGRFPNASQLVVAPGDPDTLVLRATYGLVVSHDAGATWYWVCEDAVGYANGIEDPSIGVTAGGTILAGTREGLAVSPDTGCTWHFAGGALAGMPIVDVVVRPDAPHTALVLASKAAAAGDGGAPRFASQIFASNDDGATWSAFGAPLDPGYLPETIEVSATDPHRVYASGVTSSGAMAAAAVFVSTNDAATWAPRAVPLDPPSETAAFVSGVDPTDADRVWVRTSGKSTNRLLLSSDGAATFTPVFSSSFLYGFGLSSDGAEIYVGGPSAGLYVAQRAGLSFAQRNTLGVECLATRGAKLYACSNQGVGAFMLGESDDDGATFAAKLHLAGITGPLGCAPGTSEQTCVDEWPANAGFLGLPPPSTMPSATSLPPPGSPPPPSGSASPGRPAPSPVRTSSGCAAAPAPFFVCSCPALLATFASLAWLAMRRRDTKRRRP
jgi:hypothetical protein